MSPAADSDTSRFPPAELDRRFHAFALDRLIAWTLDAVAAVAAYHFLLSRDRVWAGIAVILLAVIVVGLGFSILLGLRGTSPGRAALGLRVVHHATGSPVGVGAAVQRSLVLGVSALPTFGLGLATLAWTAVTDRGRQRRGWHDRVAHSVVVDVRPVPVEAEAVVAPRQIVNLTAMRLVPAAQPPPAPAPAPAPAEPAPAADTRIRRRPAGRRAAPRWRVAFDSGETFVVEGLALVGRGPEARHGEQVRHLVALRSDDMSLSKTHAQLQVASDGVLVVMDRGSTNGSVLVRQGVGRELAPGRPATLLDGDRVRFGDREMRVTCEP